MKNYWKFVIIFLLAGAIFAVASLKQNAKRHDDGIIASSNGLPGKSESEVKMTSDSTSAEEIKLPRLVELGSDRCIPCKQMTPILDELAAEYAGRLQVEFYDVWKNAEYGRRYNVRVIPVQIFFSPDGNELFRHEGFYPKQDILTKWKQLGYDFTGKK